MCIGFSGTHVVMHKKTRGLVSARPRRLQVFRGLRGGLRAGAGPGRAARGAAAADGAAAGVQGGLRSSRV